jgi:hypothetical protein
VVGVIVVSVVVLAFRAVHGNLTTDEGSGAVREHFSRHFNWAHVHPGVNLGVLV